jgi:hypothetical protein
MASENFPIKKIETDTEKNKEDTPKKKPKYFLNIRMGNVFDESRIGTELIKINNAYPIYLKPGYDAQAYADALRRQAEKTKKDGLGKYFKFSRDQGKKMEKKTGRPCIMVTLVSKELLESEIFSKIKKLITPKQRKGKNKPNSNNNSVALEALETNASQLMLPSHTPNTPQNYYSPSFFSPAKPTQVFIPQSSMGQVSTTPFPTVPLSLSLPPVKQLLLSPPPPTVPPPTHLAPTGQLPATPTTPNNNHPFFQNPQAFNQGMKRNIDFISNEVNQDDVNTPNKRQRKNEQLPLQDTSPDKNKPPAQISQRLAYKEGA